MSDDLPPPVDPSDIWWEEEPSGPEIPPLKTDATAQYNYYFADRSIAFVVCRWEAHNGHAKKSFRQYSWNGTAWEPKQLVKAGERPLFYLTAFPVEGGKFVIVEGEKTAIAAKAVIPDGWTVTTWAGGSSAYKTADWSPLMGQEVVIWPDNDAPGLACAKGIREILPQASIVDVPLNFPDGWDLADSFPAGFNRQWARDVITGGFQSKAPEKEPEAPVRGKAYGRLIVLSDADATASKERDYYLKGLFSPNELSAIYGAPGCGKSFLVLYIIRAITQGREVLGKRVHQTNALFMALEGVSGFEKRLKAEIITNDQSQGFYYIAQPVDLFSDAKAKEEVIAALQDLEAGILVIDTLNRAMPGGSENDPADMGTFISNLDAIRVATGVHIIVIHHSGKDAAKGLRGHTSLLGAVDVVMEVVRPDNNPVRTAYVEKAKDDADGQKFGFKLVVTELGSDQDGDMITTCVVQEVELDGAKKVIPLTPKEQLWLDTLQELFAREDKVQVTRPEKGMDMVSCVTRDDLREWIKVRGLVGMSHAVAKPGVLTANDRSAFGRMLSALKIKKKIGVQGDWVWLI